MAYLGESRGQIPPDATLHGAAPLSPPATATTSHHLLLVVALDTWLRGTRSGTCSFITWRNLAPLQPCSGSKFLHVSEVLSTACSAAKLSSFVELEAVPGSSKTQKNLMPLHCLQQHEIPPCIRGTGQCYKQKLLQCCDDVSAVTSRAGAADWRICPRAGKPSGPPLITPRTLCRKTIVLPLCYGPSSPQGCPKVV